MAVRADDQPGAEFGALGLAVRGDHTPYAADMVLEEVDHAVSQHEIHARARTGDLPQQGVQLAAAQADRRRNRTVRPGDDPAVLRPHAESARHGRAVPDHGLPEIQSLQDVVRAAEHEVAAQCLVRLGAAMAFDEGHVQPGAAVRGGRRAARDARADNDHVVVVHGCLRRCVPFLRS